MRTVLRGALVAVFLAGCVTSEPLAPPPPLASAFETAPSPYPGRLARFSAAGADPARDGLIHIYREKFEPSRVWTTAVSFDGVLAATFIDGALTLPVSPGAYDVAIRYGIECDLFFFARPDCATNPYFEAGQRVALTVRPGEELFVEIRPIRQDPGFVFVEDAVGGFLAGGRKPVETRVARIGAPAPTEAERRTEFALSTLQPAAEERDRLVVQIGDLVRDGNLSATLPLFERLNALPVPIDPTVDFYWGLALVDSGSVNAGVAKLTRFADRTDAGSPLHTEAVRLIAQAEQS